jgi:hypothetical protein
MLSKQDIRRILGRLDDATVSKILTLAPMLADVESAAMCLAGDHDVMAKTAHHSSALAEAIVEIVCQGEEAPATRNGPK